MGRELVSELVLELVLWEGTSPTVGRELVSENQFCGKELVPLWEVVSELVLELFLWEGTSSGTNSGTSSVEFHSSVGRNGSSVWEGKASFGTSSGN